MFPDCHAACPDAVGDKHLLPDVSNLDAWGMTFLALHLEPLALILLAAWPFGLLQSLSPWKIEEIVDQDLS